MNSPHLTWPLRFTGLDRSRAHLSSFGITGNNRGLSLLYGGFPCRSIANSMTNNITAMASNSQNEAAQEAEHDLASQRILAELLTQIRTDQPRVADSEASTHQNGSFCPGCMPLEAHRGMIRRIKEALNADLLGFQAMLHALTQGIVQDMGRVPCPLGKMFIVNRTLRILLPGGMTAACWNCMAEEEQRKYIEGVKEDVLAGRF